MWVWVKELVIWDWWRGYFAALRHTSEWSDWIAPTAQFGVALLAGFISLLVARATVTHQEKIAETKARAQRHSTAGDAVMLAFHKLIDCGEILAGMRNLLDEQFIQCSADGYAEEPYQAIRPSQGRDYSPRRVELSEVSFLSKAKDISLISDISLVYRRTLNCIHLSEMHSKLRVEMHEWLHGLPGHEGTLRDGIAHDIIPTEFKGQADRRAADLNLIIVSWVVQMEDTIALIENVIGRLGSASKTEFGDGFLVLEAEFPRKVPVLDDIRKACAAAGRNFKL